MSNSRETARAAFRQGEWVASIFFAAALCFEALALGFGFIAEILGQKCCPASSSFWLGRLSIFDVKSTKGTRASKHY
jgi:hypothetical protein